MRRGKGGGTTRSEGEEPGLEGADGAAAAAALAGGQRQQPKRQPKSKRTVTRPPGGQAGSRNGASGPGEVKRAATGGDERPSKGR
jgi:hypothetical protein